MIGALLSLTLVSQTTDVVELGSVDVGGKQVAVTVPAARGPYGPNSPHVEIDGFKYIVGADFNLGARYKSDGGWGEVADEYPAAAQRAASAPEYRIKVFIHDNTSILEEGRDGVWRERYGSMSQAHKDAVYSSLARMKALAETAAGGRVRVTFDVTVDSDLLFRVSRPAEPVAGSGPVRMTAGSDVSASGLLGARWVYEEIAPRINNDPFETDDNRYRGPYSSVFVIHAMRTWDVSSFVIDRTPVTSVSWPTFTDRSPGEALSIQLFYAWLQHLALSADASLKDSPFGPSLPVGESLPRSPHVFGTPLPDAVLTRGNRFADPGFGEGSKSDGPFTADDARTIAIEKLPRIGPPGLSTRDGVVQIGSDLAVRAPLAATFMRENPTARAKGRAANSLGGLDYVVFEGARRKDSDLSSLGLTLGTFPSVRVAGPVPTTGTVELSPSWTGDFAAVLSNDPQVGPFVNVAESGEDRRGYAVLASSDGGDPLFRVTEGSGLRFKASCDLAESYVLRLVTKSGKEHDVLLFGEAPVPAEAAAVSVSDARRRPAPFWQEFSVRLPESLVGEDVVEVRVAPPRYASFYGRRSDATKSLKVGAPSFGPYTAVETAPPPVADETVQWLKGLSGTLDEAATERLRTILRSDFATHRLNAIGALTRAKAIALAPDLGQLAASALPGEASLAIQALKSQADDKAWSQIASVAIRGPFGANYMFAAEALAEKKEDVTLELLGLSLLSLSWHARLAAVRTVNQIETEQAAIVASATLSSPEPDPVVRFAIASKPRPGSELLARRLLFAAVNDESEWVRAKSYLALIDSPTVEIRDQALRGVRDESVAVRLALLSAMAKSPKNHYRPALRLAVVDGAAVVRAAALRAFAVQPGEVVSAEVQNTLTDPNPLVRAALLELAKAKNIEVPPLR